MILPNAQNNPGGYELLSSFFRKGVGDSERLRIKVHRASQCGTGILKRLVYLPSLCFYLNFSQMCMTSIFMCVFFKKKKKPP